MNFEQKTFRCSHSAILKQGKVCFFSAKSKKQPKKSNNWRGFHEPYDPVCWKGMFFLGGSGFLIFGAKVWCHDFLGSISVPPCVA